MEVVGDSYNVQFIKQVPMHRLARVTKNAQRDDDDIEFMIGQREHLKIHRVMMTLNL